MMGQRVAVGSSETIDDPARDGYDGKTKRVPRRRDSIRAKTGLQWNDDEGWARQWARKCMFAEASAIRSAADLRFDICDESPMLGCFWPIVWAEQHDFVYMGDDPGTEEYYPWGRFGGFSWDESFMQGSARTIQGSRQSVAFGRHPR